MVEGDLLSPFRFVVATLAPLPELALMRVVGFVASDACGCEFVLIQVSFVATLAFNVFVGALERKLRRLGVIETYSLPLGGGVAGLAFLSVASTVRILDLMAIDAGVRQIFVMFADMTNSALHLAMAA